MSRAIMMRQLYCVHKLTSPHQVPVLTLDSYHVYFEFSIKVIEIFIDLVFIVGNVTSLELKK